MVRMTGDDNKSEADHAVRCLRKSARKSIARVLPDRTANALCLRGLELIYIDIGGKF
jgi:hypothetical protein